MQDLYHQQYLIALFGAPGLFCVILQRVTERRNRGSIFKCYYRLILHPTKVHHTRTYWRDARKLDDATAPQEMS